MKTTTWTLRLAVGTAAMLALMSSAAQAKPTAYAGTYRPSAVVLHAPAVTLAPDRADRIGVATPIAPTVIPDRVDKIGTDQGPTPPVTAVVVRTTDGGFDWIDAVIGAASATALMLIGAAALAAHGRRRVPLSA